MIPVLTALLPLFLVACLLLLPVLIYLLPVRRALGPSTRYTLRPTRWLTLAEGEDDTPGDDGDTDDALLLHLKQTAKADPKLQKAIDLAIQRRLSKPGGFRNDPTLEREAEELRQFKRTQEREAHEAKGKYDLALKSVQDEYGVKEKSWQQRESELLGEIQRDRVTNRLVLAATEAHAVDPEDVASLLSGRIKLDDKTRQPVVLDEQGNPMFKSGRAVTVKELVAWHRQQKPNYYATETGKGGEGAGAEGSGAGDSDTGAATGLEAEVKEAFTAYEEAHAKARSTGQDADIDASIKARRAYETLKKKLDESKRKK